MRKIATAALLLVPLMVGLPGAVAQARPFDDLTENELGPCPNGFNGLLPNCSIVTVMTTDGKLKSCYCRRGNLKPYSDISGVIPPDKQEQSLFSPLEAGKIIDKTDPQDPCDFLVINGKKRYVCW